MIDECIDEAMDQSLNHGIDYKLLTLAQRAAEEFEAKNSCPRVNGGPHTAASEQFIITNNIAQKIKVAYERNQPVISYEKKYITQETAEMAAQYSQGIIPIQVIIERYPWVEIVVNHDDKRLSHLRCGVCHQYSGAPIWTTLC